MYSADSQRVEANGQTAWDNINRKMAPGTKRMAGVALGAFLTPSVLAMLDNQEESTLDSFGAGLTASAGLGAGGIMGYLQAGDEAVNDELMVENKLRDLKVESQEIAKRDGPAAGVEYFAKGKQELLDYIAPMDADRSDVFNEYMRSKPMGGMVADLNIPEMSPRQAKYTTRGAMLGALAAAVPSYNLMRGGEIEE